MRAFCKARTASLLSPATGNELGVATGAVVVVGAVVVGVVVVGEVVVGEVVVGEVVVGVD